MLVFVQGCLVGRCLVVWCFHFPKLAVHFGWAVFFYLLLLDVLGTVLLLCSLFIFWCISRISENHPFFIILLAWSACLWLVVWKLEHSCQISIILLLYPFCVGLFLKQQCSGSWLSSLVYVFCLRLWLVWFLNSAFMYQKNEQPTFARWRSGHVGYQESTCRSWHPSLLPGSYIVSYFVSTFLSWVVYCGYTRPRGCLLSVHLTQMWSRTVKGNDHEQWVTKTT